MAIVKKIIRVRNPRKRAKATTKRRRVVRNSNGRFVKRSKAKTRRKATRRNPPRARRRAKVTRRRVTRRRKQNPVLIELGMVNPRRRKHVAKTRRRKARRNPRRRHVKAVVRVRRRRRNPVRAHRRRRRHNPVVRATRRRSRRRVNSHRRRRTSHRRSNPFGMTGRNMLTTVGGGLLGMAATKYLPTILPSSITSLGGGSPIMTVLFSAAGAYAAGWVVGKYSPALGQAVLIGGLIQTGSTALNLFAPGLAASAGLGRVGAIIPGQFPVPQNPIMGGMAMQGVGAFRGAFGGRR